MALGIAVLLLILVAGTSRPASAAVALDGTPYFALSYPRANAVAWLYQQNGVCRTVEIKDVGTIGTTAWNWTFGDGSPNVVTTTGVVIHTYPQGVFTLRVVTTDDAMNGSASFNVTYVIPVNTVGTGCSSTLFAKYLTFPALLATLSELVVALGFRFSRKKPIRDLASRFLVLATITFTIFLAAAVYAGTVYIPYING